MRNRKIIIAASITASLLLAVSVVFAALASNLNISFGNVTQNSLRWNVGFKGSSVTPVQEGTSDTGLSCGVASVTSSTVTIADSTLSKPDDKCTYPLTIENTGDVPANLAAITMSQPTNMSCTKPDESTLECGNITIKLKTESGADFTAGVTVEPGEEYDLNLIVHYTGTNLSSSVVKLNSSKVTFAYAQASNRTSAVKPDGIKNAPQPVCKRATTLHTDTCKWFSFNDGCLAAGYNTGDTIAFGSLGTSGVLTSGDAFDCDVNGDGTYDAETERFYYISGLDGDSSSNYAALLYYSDTYNGVPDNVNYAEYSTNTTSVDGPTTAYLHLPTTTQWSNVSLSNTSRQLYYSNGNGYFSEERDGVKLPVFTYTDRAARLLTYREVEAAVGGNPSFNYFLDKNYFLENTNFVQNGGINPNYWLETIGYYSTVYIYQMFGSSGILGISGPNNSYVGARPVIEVPLTDISY